MIRRRQQGFSLVELMVAMAIGMALVAAVTGLFASTSQARTEMARTGRMFENGRYAQELLSEDLKLAGFYGELPLVNITPSVPDPCATSTAAMGWKSSSPVTVPVAVVGYRSGDAMPSCLTNQLNGTDAIVIRRASTSTTPITSVNGSSHFIQTGRCMDDVDPLAFGTALGSFPLRTIDCGKAADPRMAMVRIYYISRCNDCARDTTPTLKRMELQSGTMVVTPLVEAVENLRIDYGFDTDNDGVADRYLRSTSGTAGAADNNWSNVMAARVHLLVRTAELPAGNTDTSVYQMGLSGSVGPYGDGWKRTAFSSAVRLSNPAGRRE